MNYDHSFHAGNFADVFKHVVLTRIIAYLARKPAAFRYIETHAGRGTYDLLGETAARSQEWRDGIGRIDASGFSAEARVLMEPYLALTGEAAAGEGVYPGSPALALRLTRSSDRLLFCEMHPSAVADLKACVGRDRRAKVVAMDGYVGLNAFIPPVERRGLVLIDPPFEAPDEFERLHDALRSANAKWREGVLIAWYPIKDEATANRFFAGIRAGIKTDVLRLELAVAAPSRDGRLVSSGLVIVNPPYVLAREMACLLPELERQLGAGQGGWRIDHHTSATETDTQRG